MTCDHKTHFSWMRGYAIAELNARKCPSCNAYVRVRKLDANIANVVLILAFGVAVVLSMKYRSYIPYLLLPGAYLVGRLWLIAKAPLVETGKPSGLSFIWFALLVLFLWLLMKCF